MAETDQGALVFQSLGLLEQTALIIASKTFDGVFSTAEAASIKRLRKLVDLGLFTEIASGHGLSGPGVVEFLITDSGRAEMAKERGAA